MREHGTHRGRPAVAVLLLIVALTALAGVAAGDAAARDGTARVKPRADWWHALDVISNLHRHPPDVPVIVLLGGSCARECTVSDKDWAAQILRRGGPEVLTYNIGSRKQSYVENLEMVKLLPRDRHIIVLIGVNLGRFNFSTRLVNAVRLTSGHSAVGHSQHHYSSRRILSVAQKQAMVRDWLARRYPVFKQRYAANLRMLERIILACKRRGLKPVMLDLPRNMAIIKDSFYRPIQRYHQGCRGLHLKHDVPFVNFIAEAKMVNRDFFDIAHAVEPGRTKYQKLLSDRLIRLLERYGMSGNVY